MWLIFLFLFLFHPLSAWSMGHLNTEATQGPLIGREAPDAILINTKGISASIIDWRKGEKAILVFWATWCPHCYKELGFFNDNIAFFVKKDIEIIPVEMGETKEDVKEYFHQHQLKPTGFVDENSVLMGPYRLIGLPTLIFIDEKGIIRSVTHKFPSGYENYFSAK
jgi:peroxiredoxin